MRFCLSAGETEADIQDYLASVRALHTTLAGLQRQVIGLRAELRAEIRVLRGLLTAPPSHPPSPPSCSPS